MVFSAEILNALIQKGLRPFDMRLSRKLFRNTECPDSKGIKTTPEMRPILNSEILNALIQKGLRQVFDHRAHRQARKY